MGIRKQRVCFAENWVTDVRCGSFRFEKHGVNLKGVEVGADVNGRVYGGFFDARSVLSRHH